MIKGKGSPYGGPTLNGLSSEIIHRKPVVHVAQHLRFTRFENFTTLTNVGMLVTEKLASKTPIKSTNDWKGNYQIRKIMVLQVRTCML